MQPGAFTDKKHQPEYDEVMQVLKGRSKHWNELVDALRSEYEPVTEEWKCYSVKFGWCMRLLRKKRAILYMTPYEGYFSAVVVLGEKAVKDAH